MGIEACEAVMPGKANVAVWDTAFGMAMPEKAYLYAIPHEYYEKYSIRRYGFHGTSHTCSYPVRLSNSATWIRRMQKSSYAIWATEQVFPLPSVENVDTSMGLTPLEGLIMGNQKW